MWNNRTISVVFPAYNEEPNIEQAVRSFQELGGNRNATLIDEILVVDNNSKDRTAELARQAGAKVIAESNQGYGNALIRGLREAIGDMIVLVEPDGTFVAQDIYKLLAYSIDVGIVCGTRTTREMIWDGANMSRPLRDGNWLVAKLMEVLYNTPSLSDCGCTFRLIHKDAARAIAGDLHVGGSHFLPNMIIAARMHDIRLIEIPVSYRGRIGESKITGTWKGTIKTALAMLFLILSSWPRYLLRKRQGRHNPTAPRLSRKNDNAG